MLLYGLTPDSVTYNLWIGAACNLGLIPSTLQLHDEMLRKDCLEAWLTNFRSRSIVLVAAASLSPGEELYDDSPDDFEGLDTLISHVANLAYCQLNVLHNNLLLPGENMKMKPLPY
ncbi:hypothetical protein T459_32042 [Capsicum annuum]|uniref:Uncharacterized protein n=1 Tax=Capsicum annuum TaxID=4072 RepID=A0A2G2Y391_CAPAN|nr:hypothetical protein T459_32042 [Capsicum annuum]